MFEIPKNLVVMKVQRKYRGICDHYFTFVVSSFGMYH